MVEGGILDISAPVYSIPLDSAWGDDFVELEDDEAVCQVRVQPVDVGWHPKGIHPVAVGWKELIIPTFF